MITQSDGCLFPAELLINASYEIQQDEQSGISMSCSSSWLNELENSSQHQIFDISPIPFSPNCIVTPSIINPSNTAIHPLLHTIAPTLTTNNIPIPSPLPSTLPYNGLNGFSFPSTTATTTTTTSHNNTVNNNNNINTMHNQIINRILNNSNHSDKDMDISKTTGRSITVTFLTMYYNELHSNPMNLKRFYHLNAKIDRSDVYGEDNYDNTGNEFNKLSVLKNVLFVDIDEIIHQNSMNNSILIRVNGTMKFLQDEDKKFEQIFFINKTNGFWLIQNDIFWFIHNDINNINHIIHHIDLKKKNQKNQENQERFTNLNSLNIAINAINDHQNQNKESLSYSMVTAKSRNTTTTTTNINNQNIKDINNNNTNMVNKRMVNKFYHDPSYQKYDNNLAIFIRGIPNNITHSKLCGILRTNLLKQLNKINNNNKNNQFVNILIDYIDVNYHKQFAFVYFGNEETLDIALKMDQFYINGTLCQIQRKRSHNGPRKFLPKNNNN